MKGFGRIAVTASVLSFGLLLGGCETFDPTAIFDSEIFNTKKKLPGERRAVFPEGTPGVPQGVPQELVKGYQPPEPEPPPPAEAKAKPKPKPKPKIVAQPKERAGRHIGYRSPAAIPVAAAISAASAADAAPAGSGRLVRLRFVRRRSSMA